MNGLYINSLGPGMEVEAIHPKEGIDGKFLLGIWDKPYAKMVEVTFTVAEDYGSISVAATGARYKFLFNGEDKVRSLYSDSRRMTELWTQSTNLQVAASDTGLGYGIQGLSIAACETTTTTTTTQP